MENVMNAHPDPRQQFRRRTNGTVDYDYYRQEALMLRRATRTEFVRGLARLVRPLAAVAIIILAIATMPSDAPQRQDAMAMSPATTQLK
jgi:hypothetical protein